MQHKKPSAEEIPSAPPLRGGQEQNYGPEPSEVSRPSGKPFMETSDDSSVRKETDMPRTTVLKGDNLKHSIRCEYVCI